MYTWTVVRRQLVFQFGLGARRSSGSKLVAGDVAVLIHRVQYPEMDTGHRTIVGIFLPKDTVSRGVHLRDPFENTKHHRHRVEHRRHRPPQLPKVSIHNTLSNLLDDEAACNDSSGIFSDDDDVPATTPSSTTGRSCTRSGPPATARQVGQLCKRRSNKTQTCSARPLTKKAVVAVA